MYSMTNNLLICVGRATLALLGGLCLLTASAACQDSGEQGTNMRGSRAEIAVTVRDKSGQIIATPTVIKLYNNGALEDQRSTTQGRAFFIPRGLGDFTVTVEAAGYKAAQKEISIVNAIQYQEDVRLEQDATSPGAPGRAVLAPKAKEALDKGTQALKEGKLEEAQKYIGEAMRLAPGNPDVLYLQGMLYMRQSNWEQAQTTLEKANVMDPNQPRILTALGMNLVNQKKFAEAIPLLEKSIQLQPASGWETELALAKAYYYHEQYQQALKMANQAHIESQGSSAQAELLLAQCLTVLGRYDDSAQVLREFLKYNAENPDATTARHWLERLTADGKIRQ
jgi:tetratricopeptide (TPR) repeat protein